RRTLRCLNRLHCFHTGGFEPFIELAHRVDVSFGRIHQHVESEQECCRWTGALLVGGELGDRDHSFFSQRSCRFFDELLGPFATLSMQNMSENNKVVTCLSEIKLMQIP